MAQQHYQLLMLGGPYIDIWLDPWDYEILLKDKTGQGQFGEIEEFLDEKPSRRVNRRGVHR
jgi:hypothetical protein